MSGHVGENMPHQGIGPTTDPNLIQVTGKSFSEAFILASTNPQYDKRLFIELQVQYMKTTSLEHIVYSHLSNKRAVANNV